MAGVTKFKDAAVYNELRHNARTIIHNSNTDIEPSLSHLNYRLSPDRGMSDYDYYLQRKSELYVFGRDDVKTMAGWIVTLPKEITEREDQDAFFRGVYAFLEERYGRENVINATVHYDEGKREKVRDRWTGEVVRDEKGNPVKQLVMGQPHLHFCFIPVVPDTKELHPQTEKICAREVLTRTELRRFHPDLQAYLDEHGIQGQVMTGIVKENGQNYTVEQLKKNYSHMMTELERLREVERQYKIEHNREGSRWT